MKNWILGVIAILLFATVGCEKENTGLIVDFNYSYRTTTSPNSWEALVVPLVLNSAQIGSSGIYIGTDSLSLLWAGTKIASSATGSESYSIKVDTLNPTTTYYWLPYIEADWVEHRGEILSF